MDQVDYLESAQLAKVFVVCDQDDTAPVWGYILRQKGLTVILETSLDKAEEHWAKEMPDLIVLDIDVPHQERLQLYRRFRAVSMAPILFFLPSYHENEILEAYAAGVDEVVIKPISPAIFLAKIMAWVRRNWVVTTAELTQIRAGRHRLEPARRSLINPDGEEISLTNFEYRLLHLLMSRPGHLFSAEEIIQVIWAGYGEGDQVLLKNVVYRLRRKIESDPAHPVFLQTWQRGYSFQG